MTARRVAGLVRSLVVGKVLHDVDEKFALLDLDAFVQGLHGVVVQHRDGTLGEDPSGVDAGVDPVILTP